MNKYEMNRVGYDSEENHFYRINHDMLERRRLELDATPDRLGPRPENFMLCPKCGHEMDEKMLMKIKVEHCPSCSGVFFESGELQTLLTSREPQSYLAGVKEWVL
jgi:hypothetical protein